MTGNLNSIDALIDQFSKVWNGPKNQQERTIDMASVHDIARKTNTAPLDIEIDCLSGGVVPVRYLRNIGTLGIEGQLKLLRSKVAVCGAGGLGGIIIEMLARLGVGHLVIVDKGTFAETDLNRQLMTTENDLGKAKVMVAAERVKKINSAVGVTPIYQVLDSTTSAELIRGTTVVMDALDNVSTRREVIAACQKLGIPFVHGAIAGFSGQFMTIFPDDKGMGIIYANSDSSLNTGMETLVGTPTNTPVMIAAWEVQEAIKVISGIGDPIRNRLIFLDVVNASINAIPLDKKDGSSL